MVLSRFHADHSWEELTIGTQPGAIMDEQVEPSYASEVCPPYTHTFPHPCMIGQRLFWRHKSE